MIRPLPLILSLSPLTACVEPSDQRPPEEAPRHGAPAQAPTDAARLVALSLPEATPFVARTRVAPVTLVDERGGVLLVLDAIGVELTVERLLADRAWVRCTGCRAPIDAWVQRSALYAGGPPGDGPHDPLLAALNNETSLPEIARHGLVNVGEAWVAPPWHGEGGYSGAVLRAERDGAGWRLSSPPANLPTP
ncbi:hypothetical protein L6R49_09810 [Myxococcota bacterium]|nr:hypothetical protein [Myxococcota bacterium]